MRDLTSASICAVFEPFSVAHTGEFSFYSHPEHKITVKRPFSEDNRIFSCLLESPEQKGIFSEIKRKTEIGNRILTITPVNIHSTYAIHFSACREKLNINYLGRNISDNSLFRKEANLILAEQTGADSFDISFFENTTGNPRPVLSAFAATALASCRNGLCRYGDRISVTCNDNTVNLTCHSPEIVTAECHCEKAFSGSIQIVPD